MTGTVRPSVRLLGTTGLTVSALTLGTSGLGNTDRVTDRQAEAVVRRSLTSPITIIDTGNNYGVSEERIGRALRVVGGLPADRTIVTKVDPLPGSSDFSGERVRESLRESRDRLGLDRLPLVHLHDPERITIEAAMAKDGPVRALLELKEQGLIGSIGVAGGPVGMLMEYLRTGHFDAVVTHNRFTLVDRSADPLLDLAVELGVGVFNAAPYGGGFLAGSGVGAYCYRPATDEQLEARRAMERLCAAHGVDLPTAALHLSLAEPRVATTIVGSSSTEHLDLTLARAATPVPSDLLAELASMAPPQRSWLGPDRA